MSKRKTERQPTLAHFKGFTKTVQHRDGEVKVDLPLEHRPTEEKEQCSFCNKRFVNKQGLGVHLKCIHPDKVLPKNDSALLGPLPAQSQEETTNTETVTDRREASPTTEQSPDVHKQNDETRDSSTCQQANDAALEKEATNSTTSQSNRHSVPEE